MQGMRSGLNPNLQAKADAELTSQINRAFDELVDTGRKLSQHSFLVNSGGAVAVLAFIGANPKASFAWWPLACFLLGVVASGLELRFLVHFFAALHADAVQRRRDFTTDQLPLDKAVPPSDVGSCYSKAYGWSGGIAQVAFPLGIAIGIVAFIKSASA